MRPFLLWFLLACPLPLCAQDYWAGTHLNFGHLTNVALAKCYDHLTELIGCYRAVAAVLGVAGELKVTAAGLKDGDVPVRSFGILTFLRGAEDDSVSSVYQYWQALIEQRNRDVRSLEAHFHDSRAERIDFYAVVAFLKTRTPAAKEAELTARGINEYFAVVFDPHTQISTFGKGTAQSVHAFRLPGTTGLIRNDTTGLFFLADGRTTQLDGITPDYAVPSRPHATDEERFVPREKDAYIAPITYHQKPWISPRQEEIQKISVRVVQNGKAGTGYAASLTRSDYQLAYALDVLDCQ